MDDHLIWDSGLRTIENMLAELSSDKKQPLAELLTDYQQEKKSMAAITLQIDSESLCSDCAGQCCQNGKYRINVLDVMSHVNAGIKVTPDFEIKPLCPYGSTRGCSMEPGLRPADCILFICDTLDGHLQDSAKSSLGIREKALRDCLHKASLLLGVPAATPLLLWAEKIILNSCEA